MAESGDTRMDRAGVIFKKCDIRLHKPDTNRACAAETCQHTCKTPDRCQHAWTLRYWANGGQREQSFRDDIDQSTGRVKYGTGKRKAKDAQLKIEHDKRAEGASFIDDYQRLRYGAGQIPDGSKERGHIRGFPAAFAAARVRFFSAIAGRADHGCRAMAGTQGYPGDVQHVFTFHA
jgi:hypothetical protein